MADRRLNLALNWIAAILIAAVFLVAGIWKVSDPPAAAVRLAQAKVPEVLSVAAAVGLGIAETFAGILLLVPRFRRWGAWIGTLLLAAFMVYIGIFYRELQGAECSCFPWVKRAVGPGFFIGDAIMMLLAIAAGWGARRSHGIRSAAAVLAVVAVLTFASYGIASQRHTGAKAPETIAGEDGSPISLTQGKVLIYFFNPECMHCVEAGRKMASLNWGDTRVVGVATEQPRFSDYFMKKTGLKGSVSRDLAVLKKSFPFDTPPAAVAIEDGFEKTMLLQFEGAEPVQTLKKIGFIH